MIDTIAKRHFTLDGKKYAKGETVPMLLAQFQNLEPTGLVERAPEKLAETAPKSAAKPKSSKSAD